MKNKNQPIVKFLPPFRISEKQLKYSIVCSKYHDNWVFVRHKERKSWEMPAGHIEANETALEAARRELYEETGALEFKIRLISDYSCEWHGEINYGRIFFAHILNLGKLPLSEIAEIRFFKDLPINLTYPDIQNLIFDCVKIKI